MYRQNLTTTEVFIRVLVAAALLLAAVALVLATAPVAQAPEPKAGKVAAVKVMR